MLSPWALLVLAASWTDNRLDFVAVDEASDVGVGDLGSGQTAQISASIPYASLEHLHVILLERRGLVEGTEDLVESSECALSPDNETAEVTTGSELEEVQSPNIDELNTGEVAESLDNAIVLVVYNKRTAALTMTAVAQLSLASTELARVGHLDDIGVSIQGLEECNSLLGLLERLNSRVDHERNLVDLLDAVTTSENERRKG